MAVACNASCGSPGQPDLRQAQEAQLAVECHHLQLEAVCPVAQVATVLQKQWALLGHHDASACWFRHSAAACNSGVAAVESGSGGPWTSQASTPYL